MYQGKFDKKRKPATQDIREITAARNAAVAEQKAASARKRPTPVEQEVLSRRDARPQAAGARPAAATAQKQAPRQPQRQTQTQVAPPRKGPRLGGVIFYTLYFLFIFLFFVAVFFGLQWLQGWLVDYEAAQPTAKSEEVFHYLFDDPDWGALYESAGINDTVYEGKDAFVVYMENLVGDQELTYQLTSSGLSNDKKYYVNLGTRRLAYFTLRNANENQGQTDIPDWVLNEVGLFYERANGYRIQAVDGHIPHINGVALSDDHIIQLTTMKEDDSGFMPSAPISTKTNIYEINDLIAEPTIKVLDASGNEMTVLYDEATDMFVEQFETLAISEEERQAALDALKVYAKYQIKEASKNEVGKHFDSKGEAYKSIMQTVLTWTKGNNGISFANDSVTNYCRYSDTMFSAYVTTELTIKLTDGGTQVKPINSTLLFSKAGGSWKVTKMTNMDVAETVGKVRLTFMNGDTVLSSDFYDMASEKLSTPLLSAPEGKVFSGWYREVIKDNGSREQYLVFVPDADGEVPIQAGTTLEPMVLYPLFEDASAASAEATKGA